MHPVQHDAQQDDPNGSVVKARPGNALNPFLQGGVFGLKRVAAESLANWF